MNNEVEIWKIHPKTGYCVSNFGRIKSRMFPERFMKPSKDGYGYHQFRLCGNMYKEHRIIWEAFNTPIPYGLVINHKDGIKTNNYLSNLELCTYKENSQHAKENNLLRNLKGEDSPVSVLKEIDVLNIYKMINDGHSLTLIAKQYAVSGGTISKIKKGIKWNHLIEKIKPKFSFKKLAKKTNFTKSDLKNIKLLLKKGMARKDVAKLYSVGVGSINYFAFYRKPLKKVNLQEKLKDIPILKGEIWRKNKNTGFFISTEGRCLTKAGNLLVRNNLNRYIDIKANGRSCLLHRIIWETYKGKIPNGYIINHKNGIKGDNRMVNLELATFSENSRHAFQVGLRKACIGELNKLSKLKESEVIDIYNSIHSKSMTSAELCKKYKISQSCVSLIKRRKAWKHILVDKTFLFC